MFNLKVNSKVLDANYDMLILGLEPSHKPAVDLIQNCDLPPPQKIFTASDKKIPASMTSVQRFKGSEEKLELLKALRLSQTRAREAERKATKLNEERDCISKAFLDEARMIFCYRQSIKLLELRVSKLQNQWRQQEKGGNGEGEGDYDRSHSQLVNEDQEEDGNDGEGLRWIWAFAICLSVAGLGLVLGYRNLM